MTTDSLIEQFLQGFERRIADEDRIAAAYVANDLPSETGDRYSDAMIVVASVQVAFDDLCNDMPAIVGSVQPVVSMVIPDAMSGKPSTIVTDAGLQIEFYVYKAELGQWSQPVARILKRSPRFFRPAVAPSERGADPFPSRGIAETAVRHVESFWLKVPQVPRALRREEFEFAYLSVLKLYEHLLVVLSQRSRHLRRSRVPSNFRLDPDDRAAVLSALGDGPPSRENIARQQLALAAVMSERGRRVCEALGAAYPGAMARAIDLRLRRDLLELGLPDSI